jgi:ADP-ribose pyrophosphatase
MKNILSLLWHLRMLLPLNKTKRPMKKLGEKKVYEGSRISLVIEELEVRGKRVQKEIVKHPGAVVILPISGSGSVYLVRQWRPALAQAILEFPAGTLDSSELPALCAQRELKEEIGGVAREWKALGELFPSPGFCDEVLHAFIASGVTIGEQDLFVDEEMSVEEYSISDLKDLIASGAIADAKTIALFCRAMLLG